MYMFLMRFVIILLNNMYAYMYSALHVEAFLRIRALQMYIYFTYSTHL